MTDRTPKPKSATCVDVTRKYDWKHPKPTKRILPKNISNFVK